MTNGDRLNISLDLHLSPLIGQKTNKHRPIRCPSIHEPTSFAPISDILEYASNGFGLGMKLEVASV